MKSVLVFAFGLTVSTVANASEYMPADQVKELFDNQTFDVTVVAKGNKLSAYTGADGVLKVVRADGRTDPPRTWFVKEDGQRCVTHPKWENHKKWANGRCAWVKDVGNGVIHQISPDGTHTHTFTNFRAGNQIASSSSTVNYLSPGDVESLFTGASGYELKGMAKNKRKEWQFSEDGSLRIFPPSAKKKPKKGEWRVDEKGRLCYTLESQELRCRFISRNDGKVTMFTSKGEQKTQFGDFRSR